MRALVSAFALGIVGLMVVPAVMFVSRLSDGQIDQVIRVTTGLCGGVLALILFVAVVVYLAWRDERQRNRPLGPVIDAHSWQRVPAIYTPVHTPPAQPQSPGTGYGPVQGRDFFGAGSEDYDLMPTDGDARYKFRSQK